MFRSSKVSELTSLCQKHKSIEQRHRLITHRFKCKNRYYYFTETSAIKIYPENEQTTDFKSRRIYENKLT
jgi:hypothetical protein